jgi:hypothetical protein
MNSRVVYQDNVITMGQLNSLWDATMKQCAPSANPNCHTSLASRPRVSFTSQSHPKLNDSGYSSANNEAEVQPSGTDRRDSDATIVVAARRAPFLKTKSSYSLFDESGLNTNR